MYQEGRAFQNDFSEELEDSGERSRFAFELYVRIEAEGPKLTSRQCSRGLNPKSELEFGGVFGIGTCIYNASIVLVIIEFCMNIAEFH